MGGNFHFLGGVHNWGSSYCWYNLMAEYLAWVGEANYEGSDLCIWRQLNTQGVSTGV